MSTENLTPTRQTGTYANDTAPAPAPSVFCCNPNLKNFYLCCSLKVGILFLLLVNLVSGMAQLANPGAYAWSVEVTMGWMTEVDDSDSREADHDSEDVKKHEYALVKDHHRDSEEETEEAEKVEEGAEEKAEELTAEKKAEIDGVEREKLAFMLPSLFGNSEAGYYEYPWAWLVLRLATLCLSVGIAQIVFGLIGLYGFVKKELDALKGACIFLAILKMVTVLEAIGLSYMYFSCENTTVHLSYEILFAALLFLVMQIYHVLIFVSFINQAAATNEASA